MLKLQRDMRTVRYVAETQLCCLLLPKLLAFFTTHTSEHMYTRSHARMHTLTHSHTNAPTHRSLLERIVTREEAKETYVDTEILVLRRRYEARDFDGSLLRECMPWRNLAALHKQGGAASAAQQNQKQGAFPSFPSSFLPPFLPPPPLVVHCFFLALAFLVLMSLCFLSPSLTMCVCE